MVHKKFFSSLFLILITALVGLAQGYSSNQKKALRWEKKEKYHAAAKEDGRYLLLNGGLRRYKDFDQVTHPSFGNYSNINGNYGLHFGERRKNFSYDLGVNYYYHSQVLSQTLPPLDAKLILSSRMNTFVMPVSLKYDIPVGNKEKVRFGANFSTNWIMFHIFEHRSSEGTSSFSWNNSTGESEKINYTWRTADRKGRFFFKSGIHGEFLVLNSSFLLIQVSRALVLRPTRTLIFNWESQGFEGEFRDDRKIDGYLLEISYKLPINVLRQKTSR
ncbi:hypothetical protein [Rhodonellum sp.]|uniref:hypothetical protein n=1 Tax=Rhodonellum sp. TaxID=2231180 RepID=UPI0027167321|nr:hypothetical protein [Rhodonellum sp.]MDO9553433.1 hypothetical protein [Rhodonellum sp.]